MSTSTTRSGFVEELEHLADVADVDLDPEIVPTVDVCPRPLGLRHSLSDEAVERLAHAESILSPESFDLGHHVRIEGHGRPHAALLAS